jgi:hypothetical protein
MRSQLFPGKENLKHPRHKLTHSHGDSMSLLVLFPRIMSRPVSRITGVYIKSVKKFAVGPNAFKRRVVSSADTEKPAEVVGLPELQIMGDNELPRAKARGFQFKQRHFCLRFAPGCHSSPALKGWGFLAVLINALRNFSAAC